MYRYSESILDLEILSINREPVQTIVWIKIYIPLVPFLTDYFFSPSDIASIVESESNVCFINWKNGLICTVVLSVWYVTQL